jgi:Protein of unknown function (DUF4232)
MTATQLRPRTLAMLGCGALVGLVAGCGAATTPAAGPTVTVTVTNTAGAPAASPAELTPTPTPTGPPGCATAVLTATLGSPGGAAGSTYYPIVFTNNSSTTGTMYGYPGVSFVTAAGAQVGAAAFEDPVYPRTLVTLAAGGVAHAELQVAVAQNYPKSTCKPVAVQRIKVYPPGQTSPLYIPLSATACSNASVQILAVQTVQTGSGGS